VLQDIAGAGGLVAEGDLEALVQEGLGVQPKTDGVRRELLLAEELRVGPKEGGGSRTTRRPFLVSLLVATPRA